MKNINDLYYLKNINDLYYLIYKSSPDGMRMNKAILNHI